MVVLERTLKSPLGFQDIKPVNSKGNQPWIFIGRTDAEAEASRLWPPDVESWLNGKDPDSQKDKTAEREGDKEDEIVGWHHQFNGHKFEQALGDGEGQGSLACLSPWGHREWDRTEPLNSNNGFIILTSGIHHLEHIIFYNEKKNWFSIIISSVIIKWIYTLC